MFKFASLRTAILRCADCFSEKRSAQIFHIGVYFMEKITTNRTKTAMLVEGAVMVALAAVLGYIRIFHLPWGGSVTLLSMLPIAVYSIRHGVGAGLMVSFAFSLIQLGQGMLDGLLGWGLTPVMLAACVLLDYIGAFSVLGFAGALRSKGLAGQLGGIVIAVVMRFGLHFLSGVVIWHSFGELWEGFYTENEWLYSLLYNGCYMLPEMIFTVIGAAALLKIPQTRKMILTAQ